MFGRPIIILVDNLILESSVDFPKFFAELENADSDGGKLFDVTLAILVIRLV